jgi:hypothetical protein
MLRQMIRVKARPFVGFDQLQARIVKIAERLRAAI